VQYKIKTSFDFVLPNGSILTKSNIVIIAWKNNRPGAEEGEDSFVELPEEYIGPGTAETKDGEEK